jgi:hypothetical protein
VIQGRREPLLHTHAVLWWFADDPALADQVETLIDDPTNTIAWARRKDAPLPPYLQVVVSFSSSCDITPDTTKSP